MAYQENVQLRRAKTFLSWCYLLLLLYAVVLLALLVLLVMLLVRLLLLLPLVLLMLLVLCISCFARTVLCSLHCIYLDSHGALQEAATSDPESGG